MGSLFEFYKQLPGNRRTNSEQNDDYEKLRCPACDSSNIEDYPEEESMEGVAMYMLTGFPQPLNKMRYTYRCLDCGFEW